MSRRRVPLAFIFAEAISSLSAHPLRSLLTALSVTFGASVLMLLLGYATGVPEATASVLRSMGSKEFLVEARRSRGSNQSRYGRRIQIRYADLQQIRDACPSVEDIAPAYRPGRGGSVFCADRSWPWANLTAVGHEYRRVTDLRIRAGRWFTKEEEAGAEEVALISQPLVDGMFDGRLPLGEFIDSGGRRFRVIGVFESKAAFAYSLFVPYPTAMEMGDTGGRYVSHLAFAPKSEKLARSAIWEIRQALGELYSFDPTDTQALDITENTAFVDKVKAVSLGLEGLVLAIAVLTLVLGCLGAANVVGIAVAERTAELGLRKALGATPAILRLEVLTETLLLCLGGGILGVGLGQVAISVLGPLEFSDTTRIVPRADPALLLVALGILVVTATLAGFPAANRAARLDPVVALRED